MFVVGFNDFYVEALIETFCSLFDKCAQEVNADAHIGGQQDGYFFGSLMHQGFVLGGEAGGADDKCRVVFFGEFDMFARGLRDGEVNHGVCHTEEWFRFFENGEGGARLFFVRGNCAAAKL